MNTRINASTTSVTFNYDLGCATSSTLSVTSSDSWITRIVVNPNTFVVYVNANEAANDRSATLQISIDGVPCSGKEIILTQLGDSGGGDDDCPTHELSGDTQEEVISLTLRISDNYSNIGCDGGSVTATPIVTYKEYKMVTTYDCNDVQQGQPRKVYVSNEKTKNLNQLNHTFEQIDCNQIDEDVTNTYTFNASYGGKTTALTVTQTCQSCKEPGPGPEPEHNPFFEVNFNQLNGGSWYYNELRTLGAPFVVSSSTWNGSSYQWTDVTITIDDTDYAQYITFDNGTLISGNNTAKTFRMKFKDNMPNVTKNGIHVTVKQNGTDLSSGATFNILHLDDILYNDIRPYVVRISYERPSTQSPSGVPERYGYYLHFKSYGDTNPIDGNYTTNEPIAVNNKVTFFADDNNCFTTFIGGSDCAGQSCGHPQGLSNRPYLNANESDTLVYDANQITYANNIKNGLFLRNATEACVNDQGFEYWYSETDIDFLGATSGSTIMQGYKSGASSVDSYYDGVRSVYLKIPNQNELEIVEGPHVLKASQVIFDDGDSGPVTVSVYEDGVAFVDSAEASVAIVNECFQNITQFVNTVYPSGYNNEIQACTLFNFEDLEEHCINDIVIEDGELIRRDESIPSPTRAMHIEQDEENN